MRSGGFPVANKQVDSIFVRRFCLFALFFVAVVSKIMALSQFEATIAYSNLVRTDLVLAVTILFLVLEVSLAVLLLIRKFEKMAVFGTMVLSSLFLSYSIWRYLDKIQVPCNCFGVLFKMGPWHGVALNAVIILFCARLLVDIIRKNQGGLKQIVPSL